MYICIVDITDTPFSLVGTGNVDKAAIFNAEGTSVWAASIGFTVRLTFRELTFARDFLLSFTC